MGPKNIHLAPPESPHLSSFGQLGARAEARGKFRNSRERGGGGRGAGTGQVGKNLGLERQSLSRAFSHPESCTIATGQLGP